jgi:hypothetical protein
VRKTPQIPEDFFEEPAAVAVADVKPAPTQAAKTSSSQKPKTVRRQGASPSNGQKRQVTIYLSDRALAALERARLDLLVDHGLRVPKSAIAEQAILAAVGDLTALAVALSGEEG